MGRKMVNTLAYEASHPWLTFRLDLSHSGYALWLLLGEASSKVEHIAGVPLLKEDAATLHRMWLIKGALATSAIEGNTLTEEQVALRLEGRERLAPSQEYLGVEIDNMLRLFNRLVEELAGDQMEAICPERVCRFDSEILRDLPMEDTVHPGEYRTLSVWVGRYRGAPAEDCPWLIARLCEWLNGPDFRTDQPELVRPLGILKAIVAHLYMVWIHPFDDGNGRTARLLEFQLLLEAGLPVPAAHLLSDHYNRTRSEYYRQLDQASNSSGDIVPFLTYSVQGLVDGLREQLAFIRQHQWELAWRNFVHGELSGESAPQRRRRHLVLDLAAVQRSIPIHELPDISPRVARDYAVVSPRSLVRDVEAVLEQGLLVGNKDGFRANRERILAFLPVAKRKPEAPQAPRKRGRPKKRS